MLNLFPASVSLPDGHFASARVHLANGLVRVFTRQGRQVTLAREATVTDYTAGEGRKTPHVLTIEGGEQWHVQLGRGCGCGDPLRAFNPMTWSAT